MKVKVAILSLISSLLVVSACSTGGSRGSTDTIGEVTIGGVIVSWREFNVLKEPNDGMIRAMIGFNGVNQLKPGDPNYTGCWPAMTKYAECKKRHGEVSLTRAQTIRLADQALKSHPTCSWNGFDPSYDVRARGRGLAAYDDTRFLFAKLNCT